MKASKLSKEKRICDIILSMKQSFRIPYLFERMAEEGITDKDFVLDIIDQLCDSGVIRYSEIDDNVWAYKKR